MNRPAVLGSSPRREPGVTLQISVAPSDLRHASETLPHQLRQWAGQVEEVLFTLDLGRERGRGARFPIQECRETEHLLDCLCRRHNVAHVAHVDYEAATAAEISQRFCQGRSTPDRDCYGNVVYPYFFGLWAAKNPYVLHLDSDMLFGGGSQTWIAEAKRALAHPDVFSCSPLPGPPTRQAFPRHVAIGHAGSRRRRARSSNAVPVSLPGLQGPAFRFTRMSTRAFILDRSIFDDKKVAAPVGRPALRALLGAASKGAHVLGNPLREPAETSLSRTLERLHLMRVDFLGAPPGMWSLHPPSRGEAFYRALPETICLVEAGEIPERQRGDYDLNESMAEMVEARHAERR